MMSFFFTHQGKFTHWKPRTITSASSDGRQQVSNFLSLSLAQPVGFVCLSPSEPRLPSLRNREHRAPISKAHGAGSYLIPLRLPVDTCIHQDLEASSSSVSRSPAAACVSPFSVSLLFIGFFPFYSEGKERWAADQTIKKSLFSDLCEIIS